MAQDPPSGAAAPGASIHATCVRIGAAGLLIRGPSGAGKSRLALRLMLDPSRLLPPAELIADDRVLLRAEAGRLIARAPQALLGLLEIRGLGLRRVPALAEGEVTLVVDLDAADAARMPEEEALGAIVAGIRLPRLPVAAGADAALMVAAALTFP